MLTSKHEWVAVFCCTGSEHLVNRRLAEQGIETYLPMWHNCDRRLKRNVPEQVPLFPGYLFAKINDRQIYQTRTVKGCIAIVSSHHEIQVVPQRDIDNVKAFVDSEQKFFLHETAKLVKGSHVRVTDGEFSGMRGRLIKGCKDGNFAVSIEVLNTSFVVRLKRAELAPIADGPAEQPSRIMTAI
ncbi:MAG: hypothetical protein K5650_02630 [Bacteroidales bacterium]|nr:hypothetical protein [Bacteroidales bacterium]